MTGKEKLLAFVKMKNIILIKMLKYEAFDKKDFEEIEEDWSEEHCTRLCEIIKNNAKKETFILSPDMCPWCIKHSIYFDGYKKMECVSCGYGERYGICNVEDSLFNNLMNIYKEIKRDQVNC